MDAFYDWHLARAIALLGVMFVFLLYAWLVGAWQERKAGRQAAPMTERDGAITVAPKLVRDVARREIEVRRTGRDNIRPVGPARRAA